MSKVVITESFFRTLKSSCDQHEASTILNLLRSLEENPRKGKALGHVAGIAIKELKHKKFRFFFITDGHMLKFGTEDELAYLLIKFVRMSEKKDQQKTIDEIKRILKSLGFEGF
ncbi:MAG: hypothetical protein ABIC95_04650 [archaeon]